MNIIRRRVILSLTGLVFAVLVFCWCLWFPYNDGEDLLRAIPANAVFVSKHESLADRYIPFLSNKLTRTAIVSFGVEEKDLDDIIKDSGSASLIKMFASRKTYLAYIPKYPGGNESAWVLSSWAGGWGQMLRWGLLSSLLKDFETARTPGGLKYWVLKNDDPKEPRLALTSVRGVLLGCYSKDVNFLQHMAGMIELSIPVYHARPASGTAAGSADSGTYKWFKRVDGDIQVDDIRFSADIGAESLKLNIRGKTHLDGRFKLGNYPELKSVNSILPFMPDSVAVFPYQYFDRSLNSASVPRKARVTCRLIGTSVSTNSPMVLAVYGGSLNGRILGVKVPTLLAAVRVHENFNMTNWIPGTIDGLNMYLKTALIANPVKGNGYEMLSIDSTRQDVYSSMKENERPALALKDGWLVICSNRQTLETLMQAPGSSAERLADRAVSESASISGYLDLGKSSDSLKNLIAVILLVQMSQGSQGDGTSSEYMRLAQSVLKGIAPLGGCSVSMDISEGEYSINASAGAVR